MSSTSNIPGMIYPSVQAMPAGNPRDSAILAQQQSSQSQAALASAVGGKRRKYMRRGGAGSDSNSIAVPQFQMLYKPTGTNGQDPNSIIKSGAQISTQGAANSTYDKYASQMGGKKYIKGGNYMSWGCYNGGSRRNRKSRVKKNKKSMRKTRKTRKR